MVSRECILLTILRHQMHLVTIGFMTHIHHSNLGSMQAFVCKFLTSADPELVHSTRYACYGVSQAQRLHWGPQLHQKHGEVCTVLLTVAADFIMMLVQLLTSSIFREQKSPVNSCKGHLTYASSITTPADAHMCSKSQWHPCDHLLCPALPNKELISMLS